GREECWRMGAEGVRRGRVRPISGAPAQGRLFDLCGGLSGLDARGKVVRLVEVENGRLLWNIARSPKMRTTFSPVPMYTVLCGAAATFRAAQQNRWRW